MKQPAQDSSQRLLQDLLRRLLRDWSLHLALQVHLLVELVQLEVVLPRRVLLAVAAVAAPAANSWQVLAHPAQPVAALRLPDSSAPEQPDSYHRLRAALVPEAELARAKPTRTRL